MSDLTDLPPGLGKIVIFVIIFVLLAPLVWVGMAIAFCFEKFKSCCARCLGKKNDSKKYIEV